MLGFYLISVTDRRQGAVGNALCPWEEVKKQQKEVFDDVSEELHLEASGVGTK